MDGYDSTFQLDYFPQINLCIVNKFSNLQNVKTISLVIKFQVKRFYKMHNFTNKEMLSLRKGTKVKIKDSVDCADIFKKGGTLVFQSRSMQEDKEKLFGIETENGICFDFSCNDYELME